MIDESAKNISIVSLFDTNQIYKFYNLLGAKMELNSDQPALCMKYHLFLDEEDNHLNEIRRMPFNTEVGRRQTCRTKYRFLMIHICHTRNINDTLIDATTGRTYDESQVFLG